MRSRTERKSDRRASDSEIVGKRTGHTLCVAPDAPRRVYTTWVVDRMIRVRPRTSSTRRGAFGMKNGTSRRRVAKSASKTKTRLCPEAGDNDDDDDDDGGTL